MTKERLIDESKNPKEKTYAFLMRWIVPSASLVAVLTFLFGGVKYIIRSEVSDLRQDIAAITEKDKTLDATNTRLDKSIVSTSERIDTLLKDALERSFPPVNASKQSLRSSLGQADRALQIAKSQKVLLDASLVESYGRQLTSLITDPSASNEAWHTQLKLADYRTILNEQPTRSIVSAANASSANPKLDLYVTVAARVLEVKPDTAFEFRFDEKRIVPPALSARYEEISKPRRDPKPGPEYLVVEGRHVEIVLDGFRLKNVVIRDVQVSYSGGPLIMENVYFVNCTFNLSPTPRVRQFTAAVIDSTSTHFDAS